jgi:histidyl-tRNA synthetase
MFPASVAEAPVDVMVTLWNSEERGDALMLAAELRRGGLRAEIYPDADKLGKQFKYAASRHVPLVVVAGDDERARGEVTVKDLRSGTQDAVSRADLAAHVRARLVEGRAITLVNP